MSRVPSLRPAARAYRPAGSVRYHSRYRFARTGRASGVAPRRRAHLRDERELSTPHLKAALPVGLCACTRERVTQHNRPARQKGRALFPQVEKGGRPSLLQAIERSDNFEARDESF